MRAATTVTSDGVRLSLVAWRDSGVPVLLLHGFGNNGRIWDPFAARLDEPFRCVTLDLRGHGDSGWATDYSHGAFLRDVEAAVAWIGEPCALVGHSLGGQLAVHFAARRPADVRALVVVDVGPRVEREGTARVRQDLAAMKTHYASIDEHAAELRRSYLMATGAAVRRVAETNLARNEHGGYVLKLDPALRRRSATTPVAGPETRLPDMWDVLTAITCPTLVIRGAASAVLRRDVAERMAAVLPHGALETLSSAGHAVMVDTPEAFWTAASTFLARVLP
jgi:pimeloyl-ACP methyl ester carboxylesterase